MLRSIQEQLHNAHCQLESIGLAVAQYERSLAKLEQDIGRLVASHKTETSASLATQGKSPYVDRLLFSVVHGEFRCFLGNTISFRFLERLLRRPNQYASLDQLREDVWGGDVRSPTTIRSAVKVLRERLRSAGMSDLATAINGRVGGHYAFLWVK